ncbi:hypothetical protein CPLU01_14120 [Colletotrichum plurivorum]|uniref:Uncharacterized protein n=1 Tax=Colletotrichum plurivorum TaxID=2175906 RepID=A0A8H6JMS3_9PEZI|nr:hypothetical protein CPLU01_14120 [Colletotrichum plurivorum]
MRPERLEPNPDIGGIGVLIGFMGTAWIVILFVVVHFVLVVDPGQNPFEDDSRATCSKPEWEPNYADEAAVEGFSWLRRRLPLRNTETVESHSRKVS